MSYRKNDDAEDHSPNCAMGDNFKRACRLEHWPIEWKEPPHDIGAHPVNEAELFFIQLTKIHKLNSEIPLAFFNHCHSGLQIIAALAGDAKFIALNL